MAILSISSFLQGAHGSIGNIVLRRQGKQTVIYLKPEKSRKKPSPQQRLAREKFIQNTIKAKMALQNPETRSIYQIAAAHKHISAYNLAIADAAQAPVVTSIDLMEYAGEPDCIFSIRATDNFRVEKVVVSIWTKGGRHVEEGNASKDAVGTKWVYRTSCEIREPEGAVVRVAAFDLAGNEGRMEVRVNDFY